MESQCKLLVSEFNNPRSVALVKENIGRKYVRRIVALLCWRVKDRVGEGFRAEETEEAASRRVVAMHLQQLCMVYRPCLIFVCWVKSLLSALQQWLLFAVCWLRVQ